MGPYSETVSHLWYMLMTYNKELITYFNAYFYIKEEICWKIIFIFCLSLTMVSLDYSLFLDTAPFRMSRFPIARYQSSTYLTYLRISVKKIKWDLYDNTLVQICWMWVVFIKNLISVLSKMGLNFDQQAKKINRTVLKKPVSKILVTV